MTEEEILKRAQAVPEPTDQEVARTFTTYFTWRFEPSYYELAKVAKALGAQRGLSVQDLLDLSKKARE